jgi:oxygen-independent coproporphyrinogen-3 oxidase
MHLYLHIPFCQRRCSYCDFTTYAYREHLQAPYVRALCQELATLPPATTLYASPRFRPSIFLGGGTPSILSLGHLGHILEAATAIIPCEGAEITIEANPGRLMMGREDQGLDATAAYRELRALGFNRLSIGVQTLHDPTLRRIGRIHTAAEAQASYEGARQAGMDNISVDLIFGLPGQTRAQWQETLEEVIAWQPDHLSLYSLILEDDTPLARRIQRKHILLPDDDTTAMMYEDAMECLAGAGYLHYEISNWARNGDAMCHHNLAYWLNDDYLAAGVGAYGHQYPLRYAHVATIEEYITAVQHGHSPRTEEITLTANDLFAETMFMGLRMSNGVTYRHFRARCGVDMEEIYSETISSLMQQGLLERDSEGVRLTARGRMLGNHVFEQFACSAIV